MYAKSWLSILKLFKIKGVALLKLIYNFNNVEVPDHSKKWSLGVMMVSSFLIILQIFTIVFITVLVVRILIYYNV